MRYDQCSPTGCLRLEITVDHVEAVQMFECAEQLGSIESRPLLVESTFTLKMVEELASVDEGKDEVELVWALEGEFERYDERIVDLGEDGSLGEGVRDFGTRDNVRFADGLESVDTRCVSLSHLHDFAETALADDLEQFEGVHIERAARIASVRYLDVDLTVTTSATGTKRQRSSGSRNQEQT